MMYILYIMKLYSYTHILYIYNICIKKYISYYSMQRKG